MGQIIPFESFRYVSQKSIYIKEEGELDTQRSTHSLNRWA